MQSKQLIIDVREPFEYESGHVDEAVNISPTELLAGTTKLSNVPKDTKIIVYCRTGSRSNTSIQILKQMGFTNLINGINTEHVTKNYLSC